MTFDQWFASICTASAYIHFLWLDRAMRELEEYLEFSNLSAAERERLIDAEWEDPEETEGGGQYLAELKMYAADRQGLLMDVTKVFTEEKIDVKSVNIRTSKKGTATLDMGFIVQGREQLEGVIKKLRQIESVIDIERTTG